jgi:hypothetical protein
MSLLKELFERGYPAAGCWLPGQTRTTLYYSSILSVLVFICLFPSKERGKRLEGGAGASLKHPVRLQGKGAGGISQIFFKLFLPSRFGDRVNKGLDVLYNPAIRTGVRG